LTCGVIAGPFYVIVSLAQALMRQGFDLTRHPWSLLANGGAGWIQVANLVLSGVMVVVFAAGLRQAAGLAGARPGRSLAPLLLAFYGLSLMTAGVFRADPAMGFPAGTPEGPAPISWHGLVHFVAGAVGFTCVAVACFVASRRYAGEGRRGWARFSKATGTVFLVTFGALAAGGGHSVTIVAFTGAILLVCTWMSLVAIEARRRVDAMAVR
jgi:hypothetical protein